MNRFFFIGVAVLISTGAARAAETFDGWNLEPGVGQAHLVMVARVASVSSVTVVEGAKTDTAHREYRFQPVKKLKGIFQRDHLSMTASDLGLPTENGSAAPPLKEGEYRLLILTQQSGRYAGCVSAAPGATSFAERVPGVTGPDDPLVAVVETLIQVADSRSRRERTSLLLQRLDGAKGLSAVPLLTSLRLRADWAAADAHSIPSLVRLARDPVRAARSGALEGLRDVLASRRVPSDPTQLDSAAGLLRELLASNEPVTRMRLTALEAFGNLLAMKPDLPGGRELLTIQLTNGTTYAERLAAAQALSRIPQAAPALLEALAKLPLDESMAIRTAYARAAVASDAAGAEAVLLARLERSIAARQPLDAEVETLGRLRAKAALPPLLAAASQPDIGSGDRHRIAWALGRMGDDRAVPVLAEWLRSDDHNLKAVALTALETLDSPTAAREARPMLKTEAHLAYKLRIARLLARHDIADGYALSTEHLADAHLTAQAALVLSALKDARTAKDLNAILAAKPDRRWHAAALTGLVVTGDAEARKQLLAILMDERHPLAADAAEAAGLAGDPLLLEPLAALVKSRNRQLALASLTALRRGLTNTGSQPLGLASDEKRMTLVKLPAETRTAIATASAALALDPYADVDLRAQAFEVAKLVQGEPYAGLLTSLADLAELEGTPLLAAAEEEQRRLRAPR